ncbi:hypothetical protein H112_03480 [Trichophyton rubrum D6]|nr:hypothetical protein H100_03483 [Trichophyton rubrum MR850]KDB34703.1 hypothetical protein H112_03480 [Trichophyton rubrum D6]
MPLENCTGNRVRWRSPSMNGGRCRWNLQLRAVGGKGGGIWSVVRSAREERRRLVDCLSCLSVRRKAKMQSWRRRVRCCAEEEEEEERSVDQGSTGMVFRLTEPRAVGETPTRNSSGSATRQATNFSQRSGDEMLSFTAPPGRSS